MKYKAILFDLDNTLIDFNLAEQRGMRAVHEKYYSSVDFSQFSTIYHRVNRAYWAQVEQGTMTPANAGLERFVGVTQALSLDLKAHEVAKFYEYAISDQVDWFAGVQSAILQLAKAFKLGVVTNGLTIAQRRKYDLMQMQDWSQCYLISEELGISKPDRAIFQQALASLNLPASEILMVGDSLTSDYQGALNMQMDFCWVNKNQLDLSEGYQPPAFEVQSVVQLPDLVMEPVSV